MNPDGVRLVRVRLSRPQFLAIREIYRDELDLPAAASLELVSAIERLRSGLETYDEGFLTFWIRPPGVTELLLLAETVYREEQPRTGARWSTRRNALMRFRNCLALVERYGITGDECRF
jgi:hypothetical protein